MTHVEPVKLGVRRFVAKPDIKHGITYSRTYGIPNHNDVLYIGAFVLDRPKEINKVISFWPNKFMHHVTLAYKPNQEFIDKMFIDEYIGQEYIIKIFKVIHDHLGCTAIVKYSGNCSVEDDLPYFSGEPHITVGTAEGVKPFYSTDLIVSYLGGDDDIFSANMSFDVNVRVGIMLK